MIELASGSRRWENYPRPKGGSAVRRRDRNVTPGRRADLFLLWALTLAV